MDTAPAWVGVDFLCRGACVHGVCVCVRVRRVQGGTTGVGVAQILQYKLKNK